MIFRVSNIVANMNRNKLIPYKINKQNIELDKNILFITPFDKAIPKFNNKIISSFNNSINSNNTLNIKPVNSIQTNLCSFLVHNRKIDLMRRNSRFCTKPCNMTNCKTCKFVDRQYYLKLGKNFIFPLRNNCSCLSTSVVYIIICKKCRIFYIGESSKSANIRINQHLNNIKRFSNNLNTSLVNFDSCSPVAIHFSENYHDLAKDFSFLIFNDELHDDKIRKSIESDLINLFLSLGEKLINKFIPNINKTVSKFSFT